MNSFEDFSNFFKNKRDQYLVDIRKNKNDHALLRKRIKLISDNNLDDSAQQNNKAAVNLTGQSSEEVQRLVYDLATSFCNALQSNDYELISGVAESIRRTIAQDDTPPLLELISTNVVPIIANLLVPRYYEHEKLMLECSWIIANIASGSEYCVNYIVELGMLHKAVSLLDHFNLDVRENAIWILANIAAESMHYREELLSLDICNKIITLIKTSNNHKPFLGQVAWLMCDVTRGKPYPALSKIEPLLPVIEHFMNNFDDREILSYTLWTLSHIADGDDNNLQRILDLDINKKIIVALRNKDINVKLPALRILGNLLSGSNDQIDLLLEDSVLDYLVPCLEHGNKLIRKETCWALSNIMAGGYHQIQHVIDFERGVILRKLLVMIEKEGFEVARECTLCFTNACMGATIQQIQEMINYGLVEMLVTTLDQNHDATILIGCLRAIESILEEYERETNFGNTDINIFKRILLECGGYKVIEGLQTHQDDEVYKVVFKLIDRYFDFE